MTPVRVDDAEQHAQGGRLARAVGAEDPVDGAFGDSEADSIDAGLAVERLGQPFRLYSRFRSHFFPSPNAFNVVAASRHGWQAKTRSEEHTSELQSLMRNSYAVFCL